MLVLLGQLPLTDRRRSFQELCKDKGWAYKDEQSFNTLIDILTTATIDHLSAQIDQGVDAVKLFDSWAGVLSPSQFAKWVIKPTEYSGSNKFEISYSKGDRFSEGAGHQYIDYVKKTSVDAVAIDTSVDRVGRRKN